MFHEFALTETSICWIPTNSGMEFLVSESISSDQCQCPQSNHYCNSVSDSGFAFTEGWAEFMQCAVDDKPSNAYLSNLGDGYTNYFATTIEDNAYTVVISGKTHRCTWYHGRYPYKPLVHEGSLSLLTFYLKYFKYALRRPLVLAYNFFNLLP